MNALKLGIAGSARGPRWLAALAASAALWTAADSGWAAKKPPAPPPRYVVSYLVSTDLQFGPVEEAFPECQPHLTQPWQWRIFDPASRRDTLLLSLPSFPTRIRWDPEFRFVEYAVANRIERAAWRLGTRGEAQVALPPDSCMCDFWSDSTGGWRVVTQRDSLRRVMRADGSSMDMAVQRVRRWDHAPGRAWKVAVEDSAEERYGGCADWDLTDREWALHPPAVTAKALLDSMLIGSHRDSTVRIPNAPDDDDDAWLIWVRSDLDSTIGLEMKGGQGDTFHAMEPLTWVDRRRGIRIVVRDTSSTNDAFGQVAFAERDGYLLVVSEYSGEYPIVADMRTGEILFRLNSSSARAVWVPAPR